VTQRRPSSAPAGPEPRTSPLLRFAALCLPEMLSALLRRRCHPSWPIMACSSRSSSPIVTGDRAMMPLRAPSTGVPRCHERARAAAAAAAHRSGQGRRDPRAAPSDRRVAAPPRPPADPVRASGTATLSRAATPPSRVRGGPAGRLRCARSASWCCGWPGEQQLGIPAGARRTAHAGGEGRRVHGLGDPARGGHRPRTGSVGHDLSGLRGSLHTRRIRRALRPIDRAVVLC